MADYNELKVTELKEELKKRSIPSTGLTRKQQIIGRLVEDDAQNGTQTEEASAALANEHVAANENDSVPAHAQNLQQQTTEQNPQEQDIVPEQQQDVPSPKAPTAPELVEPAPAETTQIEKQSDDIPDKTTTPSQDMDMNTRSPTAQDRPVSEAQEESHEPSPDNKKRKRRSATPPASEESVNKKLKQLDEAHGHAAQLEESTESHVAAANGSENTKADAEVDMPDVPLNNPDAIVQPMATSDDIIPVDRVAEPTTETRDESAPRRASTSRAPRSPNNRRFKDIINPSTSVLHDSASLQPSADDGVDVSPALHPATRALYIRDLVRPINVNAFKDHLEHLATPPGQETSAHLVNECYVDTLKTHAFVLFGSISAASRARASLHARVWPAESQRKALWVDFIPEEKLSTWIEQERSQGGGRASSAKRWEVAYDVQDDDKVDVSLVEASIAAGGASSARPSFAQGMPGAPLGPRGSIPSGPQRASFSQSDRRRPSETLAPPQRRPSAKVIEEASASFLELDKLFRFTTAKPKLYWQPVSDDLADKRLDELDRETSRDWDPREDAKLNGDRLGKGLDQLKRYTFEDGDVLVDGGPEYGGGAAFGRGGDGYRGGGGGGGRRRGADRYR